MPIIIIDMLYDYDIEYKWVIISLLAIIEVALLVVALVVLTSEEEDDDC